MGQVPHASWPQVLLKSKLIVGIDNGLDGGLCAITNFDGRIIAKTSMPTMQVSKKREVDISKVKRWLEYLDDFKNSRFVLAIEEPLAHAKSSQAVRSMALSFGKLLGMAESNEYEVNRISVHAWQKAMLGYWAKGESKQRALERAQEIAPNECWLKNKRCRKPHDGIIDAYLIARYLYGKQNN